MEIILGSKVRDTVCGCTCAVCIEGHEIESEELLDNCPFCDATVYQMDKPEVVALTDQKEWWVSDSYTIPPEWNVCEGDESVASCPTKELAHRIAQLPKLEAALRAIADVPQHNIYANRVARAALEAAKVKEAKHDK